MAPELPDETPDAPTPEPPHVHSYEFECGGTCIECGVASEPVHIYDLVNKTEPDLYRKSVETYACKYCKAEKTVEEGDVLPPEELGLPVIYFTGSLDGISKQNELTLSASYKSEEQSFDTYVKMKVQGNTSQFYEKKNFTVKFYKDAECDSKNKVDLGWGKQYKYCMKANFVDPSQARNIVSARLYAQIVAERVGDEGPLAKLAPNYGVIDGYPVLMYLNGEFYGVYTMNIPKDNWMTGMDDSEEIKQAMLMPSHYEPLSCQLKAEIPADVPEDQWEREYCSTEDDTWVVESFNEFIRFLNTASDDEFMAKISEYTDVEAVIDTMVFTFFIGAIDNTTNNILWLTYDGEIWFPTMYDMDGTWGNYPNGATGFDIEIVLPTASDDGKLAFTAEAPTYNLLWERMAFNYSTDIKLRFYELRAGILSTENVEKEFGAFFEQIPDVVYESDAARWTTFKSHGSDGFDDIMSFVRDSSAKLYNVYKDIK